MSDKGDARIVVYLTGVTEVQLDFLVEEICDVVVEQGFGCEGEDGPVQALVGVKAEAFPQIGEDDSETQAFLAEHVMFAIPTEEPHDA